MRTDELRAELTDLANEVPPFTGDVAAVRRRVARRRLAIGSIAVAVVIVLIGGAVALTRPDDDRVHIAGSGKEVSARELRRSDATVLMPKGATQAEAAAVAAILDGTGAVEHYIEPPVGSAAVAMLTGRNFLDRDVCADSAVRGFVVELTVDQAALQQLTAAVGDRGKVISSKPKTPRIDIFMRVEASDSQILAVRDAVAADTDITGFTFLDQQDAYREFKELFADQPVLIEGTPPDSLPTSFRIETRDGVDDESIATRYERKAGVEQVMTPFDQSSWQLDQLRSEEAGNGLGPSEVEVFMRVNASEAQIDATRNRLERDRRVKSYRFLSHEAAYNEYKKLFSDEPDIIKETDPADLPTSFRVTLASPAEASFFEADYARFPGIEEIIGPRGATDSCLQTP